VGNARVAHRDGYSLARQTDQRHKGYRITMAYDYPKLPPRLPRVFTNNPLYFVTFCTHRRRKLPATNSVNDALVKFAIRAEAQHCIAVGRYVIMPDHLHLFVRGPDDFRLCQWIGTPKQYLAKTIGLTEASQPIWQRGFFDHLLQSEESYRQK
jgi:REP-associated tyrosine transposase